MSIRVSMERLLNQNMDIVYNFVKDITGVFRTQSSIEDGAYCKYS